MLEKNFWQDKSLSQKIIKEKKLYEDLINSHDYSVKSLKDLHELNELALEEHNQTIISEVLKNIKELRNLAKKMKLSVFCQMKTMS
jgi:peptide chain release factor 2